MKNQKNERGITLVALVVTIVVLLILAGITIMYVMSDNGVFGTAQQADSDTNKAAVEEAVLLSINTNIIPQLYTKDNTTTDWKAVFESGLYSSMTAMDKSSTEARSVTVTSTTTDGVTSTNITISNYIIQNGKSYYTVDYTKDGGLTVNPTSKPTV